MILVPNSYGSLREFNPCHSPKSGEFCSGTATALEGELGTFQRSAGQREMSAAIDLETGEVVFRNTAAYEGEPLRVGVDDAVHISKMLDRQILHLHTHPQGDDSAFSDGDWKVFAWSHVREMRVVTEQHVYTLRKTPAFEKVPYAKRTPAELYKRWNTLSDELWASADTDSPGWLPKFVGRINETMANEYGVEFSSRRRKDSLREFNPCHSPTTGQFCSDLSVAGAWIEKGSTRALKSRRAKTAEMRPATDKERKRLGVAPAYTNVQISTDPHAELRATATTAAGKTAYYYSTRYKERQQQAKWSRVVEFQQGATKVAERISKEIAKGPKAANYHQAMTIRLIMQTGMRNGIEADGTFGATSLRMEHVTTDGGTVRMQFTGKAGVKQDYTVHDSVFADYVRARRQAGGEKLFPHEAADTLTYLKSISRGKNFKVHDIRTWYGTVYADHLVRQMREQGMLPKTVKEHKAFRKAIATKVSEQLGNTPAVALSTYIHPRIFPDE